MSKKILILASIAALAWSSIQWADPAQACGGSSKTSKNLQQSAAPASDATASKDIIDTAVSAGSFNTLATALTKADLIETLKGPGPFTVFAPTDEAFKNIPEKDLQAILGDKALLTKILTYHVIPGEVKAAEVVKSQSLNTVEGEKLAISAGTDGVKVGKATVKQTDILCKNGVIHVIDAVLVPAAQ